MNVGDMVRFKARQTMKYYEKYANKTGVVIQMEATRDVNAPANIATVLLDNGVNCVDAFIWRLEQVNPCPMKEV